MACINKALPDYKAIVRMYGDELAEKFVRGYSSKVKKLTDDYYIPSIPEIKDWLAKDKSWVFSNVDKALRINPFLSQEAILSLLRGVVHKSNDTLFITKGQLNSLPEINKNVINTVFTPNLNIVQKLQQTFPNIFKIQDTKDQYVKIVTITPNIQKNELLFQKNDLTVENNAETITLVKDFLKRIGVDIQIVKKLSVDGVKYGDNAVVNLTKGLLQVVEGKEPGALTEEAMHFAVEIIKQTNPKLYQKLLKEINNYNVLKEVFADYSSDPNYQLPDGKPNIIKLKEEAIGKILAQVVTATVQGTNEKPELINNVNSWWDQIVQFLKDLFNTSGFDQVAMSIISGENIGSAEDLRSSESNLMFQKSEQSRVYDTIKNNATLIEKKENQDNAEDDGYYLNGRKIQRVSDLIHTWYDYMFKNNKLTETEFQQSVNNLKAEKGTHGHKDLEKAFEVFVDEQGFLRETPLEDYDYDPLQKDRKTYELLKENLRQRLLSYPEGTRFMSEAIIFDPKRNGGKGIAGTVDFLAIEPDGKINILDWKFIDLNTERYDDIPWYKINAWNQQMDQYKLIIQKSIGVESQDFKQTRMIPIQAVYSQGNAKKNILPMLEEVIIGDVNVENISEDFLLPVGVESETTGNEEIDSLLVKLNAIYKKLSEKKVVPSEKQNKAEQLNALFKAIRQLQMKQNIKPLLYQSKVLNQQIQQIIDRYNSQYKGKDPKEVNQNEKEDFTSDISIGLDALETYINLDTELDGLFSGELSEDDKKLKEDLNTTSNNARRLSKQLLKVDTEFTTNIIAGSEGVKGVDKAEKIVRGLSKWFGNTATIQIKALETLFKKANRVFTFASMDTLTETKKLLEIKSRYDKWASSKGLNIKNYFDILRKKDSNELIDEFEKDFYINLKKNITDKDFKWIRENIDKDEYKKILDKKLEQAFESIENRARIGTDAEIDSEIKREKYKAESLYDISTPTSPGWLIYELIKEAPKKELWETKEWKILNAPENTVAKEFYDYIRERNQFYQEIGYLHHGERTFLPWVRKGLAEKLIFGGQLSIGEQFLRNISMDQEEIGFGQRDPLTGKLIDTIPKYFITKLEDEYSEDLFRTMALYNEFAIKFNYLKTIENQARALIRLEKNKPSIATSYFGKTEYKNGQIQYNPDNSENAKIVEDMVKGIVYQQKFIQSETFDQVLGIIGDFGEKINKKLGFKLLPEDMKGRQISINKTINQLNNTFQLQALGLNVLSASSNFLGGNFQSMINAGKYFTKADYTKTSLWLLSNKMGGSDKKKMIGALEYFLPLTDNYNKEIAKKLSLSSMTTENIQEFLMILMRNSDQAVQTINFFSYLNNSIVEDGEIVNAREFIRASEKYKDIYEGTAQDRKAKQEEFEKDVAKAIEEKGILKLSKIENDEFVIPGIDRKDESVVELRRKVQQVTSDALGNLSEANRRLVNMNIYGNSFMVFKNWIPRLVDVRVGGLKYNSAYDAYEWGRSRMIYKIISTDLMNSLGNLRNSLVANDKGIEYIKNLYEQKRLEYKEDTGKDLNMTEAQFIDLVRQNIKSQIVDVVFYSILLSIVAGLKAFAPDDEDPLVTNQYKFLQKAADKFADEIGYFYDPTSITKLISGGIFPAVGLIDNYKKVLINFGKENYALATGNEEMAEKNYVIKYVMKSFPLLSQGAALLPMFSPELAKELGIRAQSQSGIKR